jgi:hypothetical protein
MAKLSEGATEDMYRYPAARSLCSGGNGSLRTRLGATSMHQVFYYLWREVGTLVIA